MENPASPSIVNLLFLWAHWFPTFNASHLSTYVVDKNFAPVGDHFIKGFFCNR